MGSLKARAAGKKPQPKKRASKKVPAQAKKKEAPKVILSTPKPADLTLDPSYLQLFDKLALDLAHENRDTFDALSLHEQEAVLEYLSDALVDGDFSNQVHDLLWEMDFKKKPASIGDFLEDEYFMGRSCSDLHPAWREDLEYVFSPGSKVFEWVLTGAIGIGKTTIACAALAYKIYYLSCLLNPASYYGLLPDSLIVFGIYSITKRQVADAGYFKLRGYLDSSPYFRREFPRSQKIDSKVVFTKGNVQVIPGSQELHALGLDLFSYMMDEVNFMRAKADKESGQATGQAYDLYNSTYSRLLSRFMRPGGTVPGLMLLLSSRNSQTSFLEGHLKKVGKSHSTHISDYPLWEVKPKHRFTKAPFRVECGDRVSRSRLLKDSEDERPGAKVIEVPGDLRKPFEEDVDQALRDIAGVATFNLSPLIRDRQSIFDAYREHMQHPFNREELVIDCDPEGDRLDSHFNTKAMCRVQNSRWVPRLNPAAPRFMHADIGLTNDCYGLAMGHVAGLIANERVGPDGLTSVVENPYIVIDMMLRVRAAIGEEVDLSKLRGFIIFLSRLFPVTKVTFDQFQSADSIQILRKAGLDVGKNSVDATDAAYLSLRSAHFERRIAMYEYEPYETEMLDLERDVKARKVDHPLKNSSGGRGSKDVSDGVAGVVDLCINDPRARADAVHIEDFDLMLNSQIKKTRSNASDVPADKAAVRRIAGRQVGWDKLRGNLNG